MPFLRGASELMSLGGIIGTSSQHRPCLACSAGLATARQLQAKGHRVIVVEGHGRPGGRVYSKKLEVKQQKEAAVASAQCRLKPSEG